MAWSNANPIRLILWLALIGILLLVQTEGAIHAVEHWFHDADESCEVSFAAERSGLGLVNAPSPLFLSPAITCRVFFRLPMRELAPRTAFRARAPPRFV